jgi:S1-C subfamily serine protease
MKMTLCHLTGSLRGRTQYFDTDSISFGIGGQCGIVFDETKDSTVCPVHAELAVEDHTPFIRDRSGQNALLINGQRSAEAMLKDGDLIQFGDGGPLVRFRLLSDEAPECKPWQHIVEDSRDIVVRTPHPRSMSSLYLARHLLADVTRYGSVPVRTTAAALIVIPLLIIVALGITTYRQYQAAKAAEQRMAELVSQFETGRLTRTELEQRIERERQSVAELSRQRDELVAKLTASLREQETARRSQQEIHAIRQQLSGLEGAQKFAEEVVRRFEGGVGLLQGGYGFKEKETGRPLRYEGFDSIGNPLLDKDGNTLVTVEGTAPPIVIYYAGTGFLVDKVGTIVTNRHMIRMWETYEPAQQALQAGFEPDLHILRIFFPGVPEPFNLQLAGASERADLAVLQTDRLPAGVAPLTLAPVEETPLAGEPVVVLSYPGSFDSILARLAKPVSDEIIQEAGSDAATLAESLARRRLVRPLATQGHISNVSPESITFEAGGGGGSSGGPVLDRKGRVIAVNSAGFGKVRGLNLGLPIRLARELLPQQGGREARREPRAATRP